jgi:Tol biopolymer transport system component
MKHKIVGYESKPNMIVARIVLVAIAAAGVLWVVEGGDASGPAHSLSFDKGCSFGPAQHLGLLVNSPLFEGGPTVSADERTLVFTATRDPVTEQEDLFISMRERKQDPWGEAETLGPAINDPVASEFSPRLSHDGKALYFGSNRLGGFGRSDIYVVNRRSTNHPWSPPENLGSLINTGAFEAFPTPSADGNTLYFNRSTTAGSPDSDIWVSTRASEHDLWGPPEPLPSGINSPGPDFSPSISTDGRTLYFASGRPGNIGVIDIWVSTRSSLSDPWGPPKNLGPNVNSPISLTLGPFITANRRSLYFMSTRPGGLGQPGCQGLNCFDLYVAERECHDHAQVKSDPDTGRAAQAPGVADVSGAWYWSEPDIVMFRPFAGIQPKGPDLALHQKRRGLATVGVYAVLVSKPDVWKVSGEHFDYMTDDNHEYNESIQIAGDEFLDRVSD